MRYRLIWTNVSVMYNAVSLKSLSQRLMNAELNHGDFKVTSLEGYSSQHMQRAGNKKDRLVVYKNKNMSKNASEQHNIVRFIIKGSFSLSDLKYQGEFNANVYSPKAKGNGDKSNVTLRISLTNNDHLVKTDAEHEKLVSAVVGYVDRLMGSKHRVVNGRDWQLSANFIGEASLISPKNGSVLKPKALRYQQARAVFLGLNRELKNEKIKYKFDDVSNNRVGKKVAGAYFKPLSDDGELNTTKSKPTVIVFNTMNVQVSGKGGLSTARKLLKSFTSAFQKVNKTLKISNNDADLVPVVIRKREKVLKCRKNNPPMGADRTCPNNMLPKVRGDNVCCYKERIRKGTAGKYIQQFKNAKKTVPSAYDRFKNMKNVEYKLDLFKNENKKIFYIKQPYQKKGKTYYKQWKCKYSTKPEINHVGKDLLQLNMSKGKKEQKCVRIKEEIDRRSRGLRAGVA